MAEGFSIFDIFAPTQENPRTRTRTIGGLRTIGRKEKRAIEVPDFPRNLFLVPRFRSSIVIVLELVLVLDLCCCRTGENLDEASYNKLALMG